MTHEKKSKFEQIIGDKEAFRVMLDGAFKGWKGTYEVLLADTGEYLFGAKQEARFSPFCRLLRSTPRGDMLCKQNDVEVAARFEGDHTLDPYYYTCHAGLIDLAIPIRVEGELLATIFCGQVRSTNNEQDRHFFEIVRTLERELGFANGELVAQAERVPTVSEKTLNATLLRVQQLGEYVSRLGSDLLALQQARQIDQQRLRAGQIVQNANRQLIDLGISWDDFWKIASTCMEDVGHLNGVVCSMILLPRSRSDEHVVTAVVGLPVEIFKSKSYRLDDEALKIIPSLDTPFIVDDFQQADLAYGPVRQSIETLAPEIAGQIGKEAWVSMLLDHQQYGVMVFFLSKHPEAASSPPLGNGTQNNILQQLAGVISLAFNNRRLVERRERQQKVNRAWLETATHQFIAPLSGVQGHAELLLGRLERWEAENPQLFQGWTTRQVEQLQKSLVAIVQSAQQASRLAYNFSTVIYESRDVTREASAVVIEDDLTGVLIQVARNYQGIAIERGLASVEVDRDRLAVLNGRVAIITAHELFRQAVGNLVDNAVKYSYRGAKVLITGRVEPYWGVIEVINEGVRLSPGDEEKVFEREYRTFEAKAAYAPGTGLGLPVARDIIHQHGGTLTAKPSVATAEIDGKPSWRTTFTIRLPLVK